MNAGAAGGAAAAPPEYCFYPSDAHVWGLAVLVPADDAACARGMRTIVDEESGEVMTLRRSELLVVGQLEAPKGDLLEVKQPHEAVVLHWLRARLLARRCSTRVGRLLLQFPVDGGGEPASGVPAEAYARCIAGEGDQVVAVMGCALSEKHGFTTAALRALLRCGGATRAQLDTMAACANLLRWFGGVRTFTGSDIPCYSCLWDVRYDAGGVLSTASVSGAGLERSRILSVTEAERLFTSVYMLLAGRDSGKYLAASATFPQIADGVPPDARDKLDYEACTGAFHLLGVDARTRDGIWRAVSASLHLGALEIITEEADPDVDYPAAPRNGWAGEASESVGPWGSDGDAPLHAGGGASPDADRMGFEFLSHLQSQRQRSQQRDAAATPPPARVHHYVADASTQSLRQAAGLLGIAPAALERGICSTENAAVTRDLLACFIYSTVFDEVLAVVNTALHDWPAAHAPQRRSLGATARDAVPTTLTEKVSLFRSSLRHHQGDGTGTPRHSQRWGSPSRGTPPPANGVTRGASNRGAARTGAKTSGASHGTPGMAAPTPARSVWSSTGAGAGTPQHKRMPGTPPSVRSPGSATTFHSQSPPARGERARYPAGSPVAQRRGNPIAEAWGESEQTPRGEGVDADAAVGYTPNITDAIGGGGVTSPRDACGDGYGDGGCDDEATWEEIEPYHIRIVDIAGPQDAYGGCCGIEELLRHTAYEVVESRYRADVLAKPPLEAALESPLGIDAATGILDCPGPSSDDVLTTLLSPETGWLKQIARAADDQQLHNVLLTPAIAGKLAFSVKIDDDNDDDALPVVFQHTFGAVKYDVCGFTAGTSAPSDGLLHLLSQSTLLPLRGVCAGRDAGDAGGSRPAATLDLLERQLALHREIVGAFSAGAAVSWVRCLAASNAKGYWDGVQVAEQLRTGGVMSALHFAQRSHDTTMPHMDFLKRYRGLSMRAAMRASPPLEATAKQRCAELIAELSVPGTCPTRSVGNTVALLKATSLRQLQGRLTTHAGDLLLAAVKGFLAAKRVQKLDPAIRIKTRLRQSRKAARMEMSRRQLLLREEARYRCFLIEQFHKKTHFLSERRARSLQTTHHKQTAVLFEREERQRRALINQSDAWYRARREEHQKLVRLTVEDTVSSAGYSAVPVPDYDSLGQKVATQVVDYHAKVHEMAKLTKTVLHEAKARAAEEEKFRKAMHVKEVEDQRRRRVLEERRLEREARAREIQQSREASRQRARSEHEQQMQREKRRRERQRNQELREVEERNHERAWVEFQSGVLKTVEEEIVQERRRTREQLRIEAEQQKQREAERLQRLEQRIELDRIKREQREREEQERAERQRKKEREAAFQENLKQHKAEQKREAVERRKRRIEFERRALANQSLRTLTIAPEVALRDVGDMASPIRDRRTEDGRWVPLSQRMGLTPVKGTPMRARSLGKAATPSPAREGRAGGTELTGDGEES